MQIDGVFYFHSKFGNIIGQVLILQFNIFFVISFSRGGFLMERVMTEEYITPEDSPIIRLSVEELRDAKDDILTRVASGEERAILSRNGEDVAAVISIEEFWFLERAIALLEDEMDLEAIREAKAEAEKKGTISWETLKSELGL